MFWMRSGVLSDKKIEKFLGKKIYIWPFERSKLKGATYNLTASCVAVSSSNKTNLVNSSGEIVIPSGETALIQTDESIYVTEDICGTYHSKVSLVTKGLSHIGTTLDPGYFGTSLIAVHNHSGSDKIIRVGDTFVSLMFHKMSKSSRIRHDNQPFRSDLINLNDVKNNKTISASIIKDIKNWYDVPWRKNLGELKDKVEVFVRNRDERKNRKFISLISVLLQIFIVVFLAFSIYKSWKLLPIEDDSIYMPVMIFIATASRPIIQKITDLIKTKFRGDEQ
jgi:deoxycytidine triphosphate deaminase